MSDLDVAKRANAHGAHYSLRIVIEAKHAGIPVSLGFALVEHESAFLNVFGHDPTIFSGAGVVTKPKYLAYKGQRGHTRMQGVGPCQLTWWEFQDHADRLGGCWKPACNIAVAFGDLADMMARHGKRLGIKAYNGSGRAADLYADALLHGEKIWHTRLSTPN